LAQGYLGQAHRLDFACVRWIWGAATITFALIGA
jgi:hypothetical protein